MAVLSTSDLNHNLVLILVTYVWTMGFVVVKILGSVLYVGFQHFRTGHGAAPEDKTYLESVNGRGAYEGIGEDIQQDRNNKEDAATAPLRRAERIHMNEIENMVLFGLAFSVFFAGYTVHVQRIMQDTYNYGTAGFVTILGMILLISYVVVRLVYTVTYFFALQPWRTIAFALGQLIVMVTVVAGMFMTFL
eukprot:TRINITY_DN9468_c0_g1_i1.p1 TRINITY_DN9468_c0_g1~~TRINITY_DN9468_c0_g1_i1.p1  ORF type:complete len:191 (-),score=30.52 TRINITY_DN9468_c0_g1_i1:170-742(-)